LGPRNALREFLALSAHVKLLKVRDVSGVPRPLFRTIQQGGLTGYCELIIATGADGKPRVIDGFVYSTGLTLSEFMRLMFMPPEESLKVLNELRAPTPADLMYSKESLTKLANLSGEGKHAEAMEHFRKNKAEFRKDKLAFSLALRISALVSAEAHIATFEEFEKEFPGDPAVRFNRSDALKMAGKSDQALEAVDAIDREVGGDPYLDVIRAQILAEAGRMEKAAQAAKRCTDAEPALAEGWYSRVNLLLAKGDWDGSAKLLTEGDRHIKLESSRVSQLSRFDEFKTTKPYEAWMASRPR
jgi:tetratricopeptide (TPR) repeat protein